MLHKLANESDQCLKVNKLKTKGVMENDTPTHVNNTQMENFERYIYLGQRYSTREKNQDKEIQRRVAKHRGIFKGNMLEEKSLQLMRTSSNGHSPA